MITNIGILIGRKFVAGLICSIFLSLFLALTGYQQFEFSNLIIIFLVSSLFILIIGVPCSIVIDFVCAKIKSKSLQIIISLSLHLCFAGLTYYLFIIDDNTLKYDIFVFAVFASAIGIWSIDAILKKKIKEYSD